MVCIVEDGHVFTPHELACGHYRIIDLPGVPPQEVIHLCEHEEVYGRIVARRVRGLDKDALKAGQWAGKKVATKAEIVAITKAKK